MSHSPQDFARAAAASAQQAQNAARLSGDQATAKLAEAVQYLGLALAAIPTTTDGIRIVRTNDGTEI